MLAKSYKYDIIYLRLLIVLTNNLLKQELKMERKISRSYLKPEKTEKYVWFHMNPYPEIMENIRLSDTRNYTIWEYKSQLFNYKEEIQNSGASKDDAKFSLDERKKANLYWIENVRPCFLYHDQEMYEDELTEILHIDGDKDKKTANKRKVYRFLLKQDKAENYRLMIENDAEKLSEILTSYNIGNLSLSGKDNEVYIYYEYYGEQYEKDIKDLLNNSFISKMKEEAEACMTKNNETYYTEYRQIFFSL